MQPRQIWQMTHIHRQLFNTLRPRQNGRHFPDDIFKWIFLNENVWISINISLKFVPRGPINNIPTLVQVMAWRRPGDKPLSEPMMVTLPTHICVTQWALNNQNKPEQPIAMGACYGSTVVIRLLSRLQYKWWFILFEPRYNVYSSIWLKADDLYYVGV